MSRRKVFLDTNIVLDYVLDRGEFADLAQKIFQLHEQEEIDIHISALTLANVAYVVRKNNKNPFHVTKSLLDWIEVVPLQLIHFSKVLLSSFKDYEDGLQHFAAEEIQGIEWIVTRDPKGFKPSTIPIISPIDFIKKFED